MRVDNGVGTSLGWLACAAGVWLLAGCDTGSQVGVIDWRSVEARVTKLEEENIELRTKLAGAVTAEDLAGYATVDQCGSCVQPEDIADFVTEADLPAIPDVSGFASHDEVQAVADDLASLRDGMPDFSAFVTSADMSQYVTSDALEDLLSALPSPTPDPGYALATDLEALRLAFGNYRTSNDTAVAARITTAAADGKYALKTDIPAEADLSAYAKKTDLPNMALYTKTSELPDFSTFALKSQLPNMALYAKLTDLAAYAKTADIPNMSLYAKTTDLAAYAKLSDMPDMNGYAKLSDIPSLGGYAKLTDIPSLSGYAKLTDLPVMSDYAKLTDLPDMTDYAKVTDLPNLDDYALLTDLPDLSSYAQLTDLDPYALDTDLDQFDDAVHLMTADTTMFVGTTANGCPAATNGLCDFTSLETALAWSDHYSIAQNHTLTFLVADGTYTFATSWSPTHREGGRIRIVGNTTDPSLVILDFPNGGGISISRARLGWLDGVTIKGKKDATGGAVANGLLATEGGVIHLGTKVVVKDFASNGLRALFNGVIYADGVKTSNNKQDGFNATDGGMIYAPNSKSEGNGGNGYNAQLGGIIDGGPTSTPVGIQALANTFVGIRAFAGGMVYAPAATATGNTQSGVFSASGSYISVTTAGNPAVPATLTGNHQNGAQASVGGIIEANGAHADDNDFNGFSANNNATINASGSTANGNDQNGYTGFGNCALIATGTEAKGNLFNGYDAGLGTTINASSSGTKATLAQDNGRNGFNANTGSMITANGAQSIHNGQLTLGQLGNGFNVSFGSLIDASPANVNGATVLALAQNNSGSGFTAYNASSFNAVGAQSLNNGQQGFNANLGSTIDATIQFSTAKFSLAQDNGGSGYSAGTGSAISASGAQSIHNGQPKVQDVSGGAAIGGSGGGNGFNAGLGSVIEAGSTSANGQQQQTLAKNHDHGGGFSAYNGSAINANAAQSINNMGQGFNAGLGSSIDASANFGTGLYSLAKDNLYDGYSANNGSAIQATAAHSIHNGSNGFGTNLNSAIDAGYLSTPTMSIPALAEDNQGQGFGAWLSSGLRADGAYSHSNHSDGFHINSGAAMSVDVMRKNNDYNTVIGYGIAEGNTGNGFSAYVGSAFNASSAHSIDNGGNGFQAHNNSTLMVHWYGSGEKAIASGNGQSGFNAYMAGVIDAGPAVITGSANMGFDANTGSVINAQDSVVDGSRFNAYNAYQGSIIQADGSSANDVTEGNAYGAMLGSIIKANNTSAEDVRDNGYMANSGSIIEAFDSTARRIGWGFGAWGDSFIDAGGSTVDTASTGNAFSAYLGSTMRANDAIAINAYNNCFDLGLGSQMEADRASADTCGQSGFNLQDRSSMRSNDVSVIRATQNGINTHGGSTVNGWDMRVDQSGGDGFNVSGGSYMWAMDAHSSNNGNNGFSVWQGSYLDAGSTDYESQDTDDYLISSDNTRMGVVIGQGSYAQMHGIHVSENGDGGMSAGQVSGLECTNATVIGLPTGNDNSVGIGAWNESYVNADGSLVQGNLHGGIHCGASYCSARNAQVYDNNNGTSTDMSDPYSIDFGFNVYWDGWLDVTGSVSHGHDIEESIPRSNRTDDWGPIYDQSVP